MANSGPVTLSHVKEAVRKLGGEARWPEIFKQITEDRNEDYSYYLNHQNYKNTAFQVIQRHCLDYAKYQGPTEFEKSGRNKFRLIDKNSKQTTTYSTTSKTPTAEDIEEPSQPEKVKQEIYRILRDTKLAREIKVANNFRCQICIEL